MSDKTFSLEWIQNEINYYSEMCVSVNYFDYLDVLKQLRTVTARIVELEGVNIDLSARLQAYRDQNKTIAKLEAKIARLVEVGDKAINAVMDETGFATMCPICRFTDDDQEVMTHSPDCPVTLWNKEAHE